MTKHHVDFTIDYNFTDTCQSGPSFFCSEKDGLYQKTAHGNMT